MTTTQAIREQQASADVSTRPPACGGVTTDGATDDARRLAAERAAWAHEKEILLGMLTQQQRLAQAGLVTASLAHDVRNQAQVMTCLAEMALISDDVAGREEALRSITQRCRDVAETTEAFLAFTRRRTNVASQLFSLGDVVDNCRRLVAPLAKDGRVALTFDVAADGIAQGERRLAIQALVNLTSNAIKACAESGGGAVAVTASRPTRETCRLTVADDGPGVPEAVRARLFRPFVGTGEHTGGSGLGLFIVRQAALDLGGKISVRTSPQGTTFRLDLPAAPGVDDGQEA